MGKYHDDRVKKAQGLLKKIKKRKGKYTMEDVVRVANKAFADKKNDLKKLELDQWAINPRSKKIEKALIGYLNNKGLNSEPQIIAYQNDTITVFTGTPEAVMHIVNSPEEYNPKFYLILHRKKDSKSKWRMWSGK